MVPSIATCLALLAAIAPREEESYVTELRRLPEGWLAVAGAGFLGLLLWGVVAMYRREGRVGASMRVRMFLAMVRCTILVTLAVVLLEPIRVRILRRWVDSYTVMLVDGSASMDLADPYRDESAGARVREALGVDAVGPIRRSELVERVMQKDDRKFLRALAANNRVKLWTFADDAALEATIQAARETPTPNAKAPAGAPAFSNVNDVPTKFPSTGAATNLERALRRAVEALGSAPIAAVVVLSDGGFNQGASAEDIARYARDRRLPVHAVGVGDPTPRRNVRVTEVLAPENALQRDPFAVTASLAADGLDGDIVSVQLREGSAVEGGEGRVVDRREVVVRPGGAIEPVTFQRSAERVGRFVYTVEVPPLLEESVTEDNSKQVAVNVMDARTKVLLVAGGPSWDYRYVATLLQRDATFDVSCWLQSADAGAVRDGDIIIDHLPSTAEELFAYDVVILMDPDKSEFDESWCRWVDTLVTEYGGGLLYAAARAHSPAFLRERSLKAVHDLLPVTLDPEADLLLNQIGHYQLSPSTVEVPQAAFEHPVMRLAGDAVSTKLAWQGMGDVYWHYPVQREKPVATVLMRHGNPRMKNAYGGHVLAAVQFVGAGRTGFLGFDGAWRWRRFGEEVYDRFWVQLIRYLAEGKLLGGGKRGMLLVNNERPNLGETVTVTARLLDARYEPIRRDEVAARYEVGGERGEFTLAARSDRPGWFEGRFVPARAGGYRLSITVPGGAGGDSAEVERQILVSRPNLEILRPQMHRADLVTLAEQSFGGRYWEIDEAANLPGVIPDLHEEVPIRSRPTTLWDRPTTLAFLVFLMSLEWAVRKWNRLL